MDDERAHEGALADRATPDDPGSFQVPQVTQLSGEAGAAAPNQPPDGLTGSAALSADITAAWTNLERDAQLLVKGSAAALILILIGLPLSIWDSATFALLILAAGTITVVTAWFGASPTARSMPIPVSTIELIATYVAAILAIMKVIEVVFDFDTDGIIGLVVAVALLIATTVMIIAVNRRGADPLAAVTRGDQGTKIAAVGLVLVLLGWLFNLSSPVWTMGQAALPLAVLTIAALTVAEAPRIQSPVPVAWVGAAIGIFGALLVLGNWNELLTLGRTDLELDPGTFIGVLTYTAGTALIIAGGILSGRSQWTPPPMATAPTTDASDNEPDT